MIKDFKLSEYNRLSETTWANPKILKDGRTEIKIVSVDKTLDHNYPILCDDGNRYSLNGKNESGVALTIRYDMKPPIIDGRIVSDKTFATRFKSFLEGVTVNDLMGEEELEYLQRVADNLLEWQKLTVTSEEEIEYFKNLGVEIKKET